MSTSPRTKPSSPCPNPYSELSRYLTPQRYRKRERWVAALPDFIDVHRSIAQDQYRYIDQPRNNYARPRGAWLRYLAPTEAHLLSAAVVEARVAFAKIALRQLRCRPDLYREQLHFVTVSRLKDVRPFETASQTNLHSLQRLTGQAFAGLSFVGAPDFALFKAWGPKGIRYLHNHVGPHTHNIVFGASRAEIKVGMQAAGLGTGGWTGGAAYHIKEITAEEVEGYLLYLLKVPLFFYHAKKGVRVFRSRHNGEREHHALFKPFPLRPADQLRMAAVVHAMYLDELLFGQGEGTELVGAIRDEAREPLRRRNEWARRQGRREILITVSVRPECRALLSDCIREPLIARLLRQLSRVRSRHVTSTSSGPRKSAWLVRKVRTHDAELDDLDGEM